MLFNKFPKTSSDYIAYNFEKRLSLKQCETVGVMKEWLTRKKEIDERKKLACQCSNERENY